MGKICEICKKEIEGTVLEVEEHNAVCFDCATQMALQAREENREIEILEMRSRYIEEWALCAWCDELHPKSELREEMSLGLLCGHCIEAIHSHGETLILKY